MRINLTGASFDQFVQSLFDHPVFDRESKPWHYDARISADDPEHQVDLLSHLFRSSNLLLDRYSNAQIEIGLWCIFGGASEECSTKLVWNPKPRFDHRAALVASVYDLYDQVLARVPYEPIDFIHADDTIRRFSTIDYMATDLLVNVMLDDDADQQEVARVGHECLLVLERLLKHPAPVAQYAALHGLGHLKHVRREEVVAEYVRMHPDLTEDRRTYAGWAQAGDVL